MPVSPVKSGPRGVGWRHREHADKTLCQRASTCFAAKLIESFPGKLAFDDLAFDNFPIIFQDPTNDLIAPPIQLCDRYYF